MSSRRSSSGSGTSGSGSSGSGTSGRGSGTTGNSIVVGVWSVEALQRGLQCSERETDDLTGN